MNARQALAEVLRTTDKNLNARIAGLKIGPACSRCGGSGRYSFNQMDGDRCFGCRGAGCTMPTTAAEIAATAERALQVVADGTLDKYIARARARARSKDGSKRFFAAWNAMDALNGYGKIWLGSGERAKVDPAVAKIVARNSEAHEIYKALAALDKFDGSTDWVAYDAVLTAGLARLAEIIAEIEAERVVA